MPDKKILIYGYGNPGRQDDGLGPYVVDRLEKWAKNKLLVHISFDSNYQLNIEDAVALSENDIVIFIDASIEEIDNYILTKVEPSPNVDFSMHSASPAYILELCQKMYNKQPQTYLLHIKGYEWEMKEELTEKAERNAKDAIFFLQDVIVEPELLEKVASE